MKTRKTWLTYAIFSIIVLFFNAKISAQVGIGTTTPNASAALDIVSNGNDTGVLFPRMTTIQRDAIASPATGLLIYNITTNSFNYNMGTSGTPNWVNISNTRRSARFGGGADTTTNLNTAALVNVPVFNVFFFNDDTTLFVANPTIRTLTIGETGRYRISINMALLRTTTGNDINVQAFLNVNGANIGAGFAIGHAFIRGGGNAVNESSINMTDVILLNAGDVLAVQVQAEGNGTPTVVNRQINSSGFFIEKLD